jgi:ABC-type glycerol-3-phosphate transport system substrate-binding protein
LRLSGKIWLSILLVLVMTLTSHAALGEKVKIRYAHWGENPGYRAKIEAFNASQDLIEVEYVPKRITLVEIVGGVGADAFTLHAQDVFDWASQGLLRSLDEFYVKDKAYLDDIFPPAMAQVRVNGQIWAIPHYLSGINGLWYNKTKFIEAGVPTPNQDWTWNDEMEAARKLVRQEPDGRITQWAFTPSAVNDWRKMLARTLTAGGRFLDERGQFVFGDEVAIRAANWMVEYARLEPGGSLEQGTAAMHAAGISWQEPIRTSGMHERYEVGATTTPRDPVTGNRSKELGNNIELMGMNPNTKYPQETWQLMKFLISQEAHEAIYERIGYVQMVPAKRSVAMSRVFLQQTKATADYDLNGFIESWALHAVPLQIHKWGDVHSVISGEWTKTYLGQQPVEAFFTQIRQLVPPILAGAEK